MNEVSHTTTSISEFNNTVETLVQTTILFIVKGDCGFQNSVVMISILHP